MGFAFSIRLAVLLRPLPSSAWIFLVLFDRADGIIMDPLGGASMHLKRSRSRFLGRDIKTLHLGFAAGFYTRGGWDLILRIPKLGIERPARI